MINRPISFQESRNNGFTNTSPVPPPMRSKSPLLPSYPASNKKNPMTFDDFMNPSSLNKTKPAELNHYFQSIPAGSNSRKIPDNVSFPSQSSSFILSSSRPRQGNLLQYKELAKQKEMMILKRKASATKIQSHFRGYRQRKKFKVVWENHLRKLRLEHLRQIAKRIKELFAPYIILRALQKWVQIRRKEKLRVMNLFRQYSALFIQKVWKGYSIRKKYKSILDNKRIARSKIRALVRGWKIRKIIKRGEILALKQELKDLVGFEVELREQNISKFQYLQVQNQIPLLKEKIIKEIDYLYISAEYLHSYSPKKPQPSSKKPSLKQKYFSQSEEFTELSPERPALRTPAPATYFSRDELPVKSCEYFDETEQAEPSETVESKSPPKRFTNFLRRGQNTKYNPKAVAAKPKPSPVSPNLEEPVTIPKIPAEFSDIEVDETEDQVFTLNQLNADKDFDDEDEKQDKPKHNFLKRKSQTYQPKKIEWKAKTRVNCWGESINSEPKPKHYKKKSPETSNLLKSKVAELELVFEELRKQHVSVFSHFGVFERISGRTSIPQINPYSSFITDFDDESYQEAFESLQTHYLHLCNEEDM